MKGRMYKVVKRGEKTGPVFLFEQWANEYVDKFLDREEYEVVPEEVDVK